MELSPFLFGLYKLVKYLVYPLTWLCILLAVLTVITFLPSLTRRLLWMRVLAIPCFLLVFLLGNPIVSNILLGLLEQRAPTFDSSDPTQYDAIVVLGGGILTRGTLRPEHELTESSLHRTVCGVELFRDGWAPSLLLVGGDATVFGKGPKESVGMKRLAESLGVPAGAIKTETRSRNTYENAVGAKRMLGDASVLVVTSAMHLPRALGLFRKQGLQARGYPCGYSVRNRPGDFGDGDPFQLIPTTWAFSRSTNAVTESVGTLAYKVVGKL